MTRDNSPPAIELVGINKSFGPVHANRDIDLTIEPGTIHGIIGENGAGKSTLMSILYGFYQADSGEIRIKGVPTLINDSQTAIAKGIGMVHQHFMLVDNFTVLENIILGAEGGGVLNSAMRKARAELLRLEEEYGLKVDPDALVEDLPVGLQDCLSQIACCRLRLRFRRKTGCEWQKMQYHHRPVLLQGRLYWQKMQKMRTRIFSKKLPMRT